MKERERLEKERLKAERSNKLLKASNKIDYGQGLRRYQGQRYCPYGRVDYMPHKKNQLQIKYEMDKMKKQMQQKMSKSPNINRMESREEKIAKLQDKFQYLEGSVMPKDARMPGLIITEEESKKQRETLAQKLRYDTVKKEDKRAELERLYNNVLQEIDERYQHMTEMKKLGKNVDNVMMGEIKERIQDMKNIEKLIEEYDKGNIKK